MNSWKTGAVLAGALMVAAAGGGLGGGTAVAEPPGGTLLPLGANFRACDFSENGYPSSQGAASGQAVVSLSGNTVSAVVNIAITPPFAGYRVRLIQIPRPASSPCNQGDPGVASTMLFTDGNGVGSATVTGPRQPGATGAWVYVDGPPKPGRTQGEFYTTDYTYDF